ncbi:DUF5050 domain-containing protein [Fusibacter bizertensis]
MKKKVLNLYMFILLVTMILVPSKMSWAATVVSVSLPNFEVTLNGIKVENNYNKYPLIVYNDITYFPMTYYDSRFMGLESIWDANSGLKIIKNGGVWEYRKDTSNIRNSNTYNAQVVPFKIMVNGEEIDNSKEKYPLLLFRNITYFPLTWRFAVEEFDWDYSFDSNNGLSINASSGNVYVSDVILPIVDRATNGKSFTMAGKYYYYEGENGQIFQTPQSNASINRVVYQLPLSQEDDSYYVNSSLYTDNNEAILKYHTGGALMGSDSFIWLKEDGTTQELDSGYLTFKIYDEYTIRVNQWFPPLTDNLQIKKNNESEYINVGNPDLTYGLYISRSGNSMSAMSNSDFCLIDEDIYSLGFEGYYDENETLSTTGIYRVDIKTNETERICDDEVKMFKIVDNMIYFIGGDNYLYRVPATGGEAELLVKKAVALYESIQGNIYYSLAEDQQLRVLGKDEIINKGGTLAKLEKQGEYLIAYFEKKSISPYKMIIINNEGSEIYKTLEPIDTVRIQSGKIVLIKNK